MRKLIICLLLLFIIITTSTAQDKTNAIYLSNPMGLINKFGIKFEFRHAQQGYVIGIMRYFDTFPNYPGTQLGLEWRRYANKNLFRRGKIIFMVKQLQGIRKLVHK
jgi:hypothetical protein